LTAGTDYRDGSQYLDVRRGGDRVVQSEEAGMRIGIIGAGKIGSTVGKLWVDAGHEVKLSSRHPNELEGLVESLGERASAGTSEDAARFGEVVMITVPLKAIPELAQEVGPLLAGKVVLDTGNAYVQRDGDIARESTDYPGGSAVWAAAKFPRARWVKAFNSVNYRTLESEAHRQGDRVGIPLASDDQGALEIAARLVRDAGFDPVILGPLARGTEVEPSTRVYNTGMSGPELRRVVAKPEQSRAGEPPAPSA
jgi:8-hydroxy-5-deazaflavin:NADPH oxidoreductase